MSLTRKLLNSNESIVCVYGIDVDVPNRTRPGSKTEKENVKGDEREILHRYDRRTKDCS